ncbi:tetratricopeptide repeat protein [Clostridium felsineum]|uniref:tetratricopeptide repeat protein n=1 Tax=Clostridium felsineum TaxID=36839 RepID=UPI00098C7C41|nr:tetratricopeptide repeat protein [Clostridium felsineum]URZ04510.1 hypothetical protein CLAUR_045990 [Clostridium felsineum]
MNLANIFMYIIPIAICIILPIFIILTYFQIKSLNKAVAYFNKGKKDEALAILAKLVKSPVKNVKANAYLTRERIYFYSREFKLSLEDLLISLRLRPKTINDIYSFALSYHILYEPERALKYFLRAVELQPNSNLTYENLGWFYYLTNDYNKAIETFNKSLELGSTNSVYRSLGITYAKLGNYEKAEEYLNKALDAEPEKPSTYIYLSYLRRKTGDIKKAKEFATKAIDLNKNNFDGYKNLAEVNLAEDDYEGFYKNLNIFLGKINFITNGENFDDEVYEKVKDKDEYKAIMAKTKTIKFKDLDIEIDDKSILNGKFLV